jgi:hypothetical protein
MTAAQGADAQPPPIKAEAAMSEAEDRQQSPTGGAGNLTTRGKGSVGQPIGREFPAATFGAGWSLATRSDIGQSKHPKRTGTR